MKSKNFNHFFNHLALCAIDDLLNKKNTLKLSFLQIPDVLLRHLLR